MKRPIEDEIRESNCGKKQAEDGLRAPAHHRDTKVADQVLRELIDDGDSGDAVADRLTAHAEQHDLSDRQNHSQTAATVGTTTEAAL